MNITLTKQGRYTYINLDGKSIKCASAATAKKLKETIEQCGAMTPATPQAQEASGTSIDKIRLEVDGRACVEWSDGGLELFEVTPADPDKTLVGQAEILLAALKDWRDRRSKFGRDRRVWTVMDIPGWTMRDVDACKENPAAEPYARDHMNPREDPAQKDIYQPPWEPWEEWCSYEDLGPINSKIDGETQLRRSIVNTIAWKRFDDIQKLIEADPAVAKYDLVLTRAWYPLTYHDRIDSVAMLQGRISSHPLLACFHTANFVATHFGLPIGVVASENGDFQSFAPVNQQYSGYPEHFCLWQNPGAWGVRPENRPWKLSSDRGILFL